MFTVQFSTKDVKYDYAHGGIYLRTEKLSVFQIRYYVVHVSKINKTILTDEEIIALVEHNEYLFTRFEYDIGDDWRKQQQNL